MFLEIMIKGYVQPHWFEDQAALYGVLRRIQDLGMVLISVNPVEMEERI